MTQTLARPSVMSLTPAAVTRIQELMVAANKPVIGLRVGVRKGGCAGMSYTMDLVSEPDPKDEKIAQEGVTVFVAPGAVLYLLGTQMDFQVTKMSSQFVFHNPNEVSSCGCGESVSLVAATQ